MAEKKNSKKNNKEGDIVIAKPVLEAMSEIEKYNLFKKNNQVKNGRKIKKLGDSSDVYVSNLLWSNNSDPIDSTNFEEEILNESIDGLDKMYGSDDDCED